MVKDPAVREGFNNQFYPYPIKVATTDSNNWFILIHIKLIGSKNNDF